MFRSSSFLRSLIFLWFLSARDVQPNPFAISFPPTKDLSNEDYIQIQEQLRGIDILPLVRSLYPDNQGYTTLEDFHSRSSRGISQVLIDQEKRLFPTENLVKINNGGDHCLVCCVPYDGIRTALLDLIVKELHTTGFNGYFLYQKGGFPNPTGKEIQYAGVPYSFKIFMMLEAVNRGFKKVIWIDSACLPLRDPTPLFHWLDRTGSFIGGWNSSSYAWRYILPSTWRLLKDLTGTDVLSGAYVHTRVFGLKMDSDLAKKLIKSYCEFVELGTPFLSCYPEEFVLKAILGQPDYSCWGLYPYEILSSAEDDRDPQEKIRESRDLGYFFYQLIH